MSNEAVIEWLENYSNTLKSAVSRLDKRIDDYESEKKEILYNIKENEKLIRHLRAQ